MCSSLLKILVALALLSPTAAMPHIVTFDNAVGSWHAEVQSAFKRGYDAWFADQICQMFGVGCSKPVDQSPVAENAKAALEEGLCTGGNGSPCANGPSKFVNPGVPQAKSVLRRQSALTANDVSAVLPGKLWGVGNGTLDKQLKWRDSLDERKPSPLQHWGSEALALMGKALEEDELSAFEVHATGKFPTSEYDPIDVPTFLVNAPGAPSEIQYDLQGSHSPELVPHDSGRGHKRQLQNAGIYPWPSAVYGPNDDRIEITFPSNFVWGWSTLVSTGNRPQVWCSGTMISPTVVLTAAHCVASSATMGTPGGINWLAQPQICVRDVQRVTPSAASPTVNDCTSNGGILATWSKMTTFVKWARDGDTDWDIAWITLNTAVGYTSGWKGIRTSFYSPGTIVNNAGYGGDCAAGADCSDHMRTHWCEIEDSCTNDERYYFKCDVIGGMSGSGTYIYYSNKEVPNNRFIIGVLAYARGCGGFNRAVRIRPNILTAMCSSTTDMLCF